MGGQGGPREDPVRGFQSFAARETGDTRRVRPESFADHFSQARQFYVSQTANEQDHIAAAFTFELSKVQRADIRERVVAHLVNVHEDLATAVADGLGIPVPPAAPAAVATRTDLAPSPALSILANPPGTFTGRRVGALVSNGADASLLQALRRALKSEGAELMIVAPSIDGITASDGTSISVDERIGGGPSVLFDAVALIPGEADIPTLAEHPGVHAFVADAFAHCKFVAFNPKAEPLLLAAGITNAKRDEGFMTVAKAKDAIAFVEQCRALRFWEREASLP